MHALTLISMVDMMVAVEVWCGITGRIDGNDSTSVR